MTTFFDVTRTWLLWSGPPDGVARTVFGLCAAGEPLGIMPIVRHPLHGRWYRVPRFTASSRAVADRPSLAGEILRNADRVPLLRTAAHAWRLRTRLAELESIGAPVDPGAGDTVHLLEPPSPGIRGHFAALTRLAQHSPGCEIVALVHDLHPLDAPELATSGTQRMFRRWTAFLGEHADRILVASQAIADSVRRHVPGTPIGTIRLATRIEWCPTTAPISVNDIASALWAGGWCSQASADPMVQRGEWLLSVGRLEPRTNHDMLLDALEPLWRARRLDLPLVIAGRPSTATGSLRRRIRRSPVLRRHVALLGAVPDEALWHLYRGARLSIAPSLHSGVSLSVSESLQLGTPCLASRACGVPEGAADRIESFDPRSREQLQSLLLRTVEDKAYERRLRERTAGFAACAWSDTVEDMTGRSVRRAVRPRLPQIDAVYAWCDDSDPRFRSELARWRPALRDACAAGEARFRSQDELKYSLRSLEAHAPWVRNVFLVTDGQAPDWLDRGHPDMHVVSHADIFEDAAVLPCFNSRAIETNLHRIPGLSGSFLYLNDDFLIGNSLSPESYFSSEGRPIFLVESYPLPGPRGPWLAGADEDLMKRCHRSNHRLLRDTLRTTLDARDPPHVPQLYITEVLAQMERTWLSEYRATRACRFRTQADIKMAVLYPHFAAERPEVTRPCVQRTLVNGSAEYIFRTVHDRDAEALDGWLAEIESRRPTFFCVNDAVESPSVAAAMRVRYQATLERMFPEPSRFERTR